MLEFHLWFKNIPIPDIVY